MYVANREGDVTLYAEFKNAHGGAMAIWRALSESHLGVKGPEFMALMMQEFKPLFDLHKQGKLEPWEAVVLTTTYDRVFIPIEHVASVASAFEKFDEVHGFGQHERKLAFSIGEQAKNLRFMLTEIEEKGWRGVCWNQTSVNGDALWYGVPDERNQNERRPYNIDQDDEHWVWPLKKT